LRFVPPEWLKRFQWINEPADEMPRVLYEVRNQAKTGRISINLQVWHLGVDRYGHETHREQRVELMRKIQSDPENNAIFKRKGRTEQDLRAMVHSIATAAVTWDAEQVESNKQHLCSKFGKFVEITQPLMEKYLYQTENVNEK
jgi:hypothetical protein